MEKQFRVFLTAVIVLAAAGMVFLGIFTFSRLRDSGVRMDREDRAAFAALAERLSSAENIVGVQIQVNSTMGDYDRYHGFDKALLAGLEYVHQEYLYGASGSAGDDMTITVTLYRKKTVLCGGIGWSCAWAMNIYARLGEAEQAYEMLSRILRHFAKENLLNDYTPIRRIIQIESNFGAAAGIAEMLLQSHGGVIRVLPALPKAWDTGSFRGLMARGGVAVSASWEKGRVTKLTLTARKDAAFKLTCNGGERAVTMTAGQILQIL